MKSNYTIDITMPINHVLTKDRKHHKPFEIAHRICQAIDRKDVLGIGQSELINFESNTIDGDMLKLTMNFNVTD